MRKTSLAGEVCPAKGGLVWRWAVRVDSGLRLFCAGVTPVLIVRAGVVGCCSA
ncbi:hypothetical protein [Oceanospirillum sediminis]|uniref:Uncharacterized protein n=1 Tax=Oceanospirillum sediminis TaxID=2760088 RepID=A0A839IMR1_9GAMM|nr:hypothetical protein [Oceanospirillum sediminis]MBB1485802.1 hypothetical protein [Oceanospirillum sediminis]